MVSLLRSVGWDGRTVDPEALGRAIEGTPEFAAAWDGDRLVGTARSLTDGAMYAHDRHGRRPPAGTRVSGSGSG